MAQPTQSRTYGDTNGMDPNAVCGDTAEFEKMIQAQLSAQLHHSRVRMMRDRPHVATMDMQTASNTLHAQGALKAYKPDRVTDTAKLDALSAAELTRLLKQQNAMLADKQLLQSLPDKGAKVQAHVAALEAQLAARRKQDEADVNDVESMLDRVTLSTQDGSASSQSDASAASASAAASSSPATAASPAASSASAASSSSSPYASLGRGGAVTAVHCDAAAVNARVARETAGNIESKFRRPPPQVIPMEEANRLLREKADDWHSGGFGLSSLSHAAMAARAPTITREPRVHTMHADDDVLSDESDDPEASDDDNEQVEEE